MAFIFVFGSNLAGQHLGGAARTAHLCHKAEMGVGEGRTGNAYALPTLTAEYKQRSLDDLAVSIVKLVECAHSEPENYFYVTRVGCGIAGFTDAQIAPMFFVALEDIRRVRGSELTNIAFDPLWSRYGLPAWEED